jgi:hypothetical protein
MSKIFQFIELFEEKLIFFFKKNIFHLDTYLNIKIY